VCYGALFSARSLSLSLSLSLSFGFALKQHRGNSVTSDLDGPIILVKLPTANVATNGFRDIYDTTIAR